MPRFLVVFFPLTLLHLGRCWSKWFFTTPLLIVPNREAIGKIKREIWDETNRTNVVERTHDLTGWCCRMTIPPTPLRHSSSLRLQVTSNQGCVECHHGGRARDVDDDTERCLHIMKWQEWDSNKHLHFPGQGHWRHLFSRSRCLMSFSRQHSLRRSWCNYLPFLFFWCWGDYEKRIIVLIHICCLVLQW